MEQNINPQEILKKLKNTDSSEKREAIESINYHDLDNSLIGDLIQLIKDEDKGVRDAVSNLLILSDNELIPRNVVPLISSDEISVRNLAGEILLKKKYNSLPAIKEYLTSCNDDDQKFLIDIAGLIGDDSIRFQAKEILSVSKNDNVILACIEALGNVNCQDCIDDLIKVYDQNELFKPTVIEALGKIGNKEAVNFIIERYPKEDELTKFSMIESLGEIGNEEAFFLLVNEIRETKGPISWPIVESLMKLQQKFSIDVPFDENFKNIILRTLIEGEPRYKRAASNLITVFEDKEVIEASLSIYGIDEVIDNNVKTKFFENPSYLYPKLTDYLNTKPKNLKELFELTKEIIQNDGGQSLGELSALDIQNLSDVFANNLTHPDEEVRRSSIELLFFTALDKALLFTDTMLEDDDMWNRMRLLEILETINDERSFEAIKQLSKDSEEMIAERAEYFLNQLDIQNS
ncbi:MAG: hypothetical protein CMF23_06220 [Ignavibacteriae bacterium]|nr:hypothetical protein [Ignavibacteriota bacterium]